MTRLRRDEWIALLILATIVSYQVFIPPIIGLANNADFAKAIGIFGLAHPFDDEYKYVTKIYDFDPQRRSWWGFISSEQPLAGMAVLVNSVVRKDGRFDVRMIGAVHTLLYLSAFYLLLPVVRLISRGRRILLLAVLIFMFGDVMYVSYMNTFYMDAAALVFLLLTVVLYVRSMHGYQRVDLIAFVACAILFTASKCQHAILGLLLGCLVLFSWRSQTTRRFRIAAALLIVTASVVTWRFQPGDYSRTAAYTAIFTGILPSSHDVDRDLEELGLDGSYRPYIGTHAFSENALTQRPELARQFESRTSYGRIAWFYVRHPERAYRVIRHSLDFAGRQRPAMGNFDRSAGLPPSAESNAFAVWSNWKRQFLDMRGARYVFYFLCMCISCCLAAGWRERRLLPGAICLCLMGLCALLVGALADAVEITRHLFLFNTIVDLILICTVAAAFGRARMAARRP